MDQVAEVDISIKLTEGYQMSCNMSADDIGVHHLNG